MSSKVTRGWVLGALLLTPVHLLIARDVTHAGLPLKDLVTLQVIAGARNGCGPAKFDVVRVLPDATSGAEPFRIPDGRALVVTEVDWHYFNGPPNVSIVFAVIAENLGDSTKRSVVCQSPVRLGADGAGGASERMTTGFALSSSARFCFDVVNGSAANPVRLSKVLLRGYLVDEQ
jgi:hypothetical protein